MVCGTKKFIQTKIQIHHLLFASHYFGIWLHKSKKDCTFVVKCRFLVIMLTKHYIISLLSLVLGCASCQWHEAEAVIAMADSIDQTQHVIYNDTAALGLVIRQLDNPMGRVFKHSTLGKAYYYMGRNLEDSYQQIAEAAKCYIEADRLQIDDPIYRGRVNTCMGYICGQSCNDSMALIFNERAYHIYREYNNKWYYAHALLSKSESLVEIQSYPEADSLLHIAETYELDSTYQARYYEIKGLYFYKQQQYDSALVYFRYCEKTMQKNTNRCLLFLYIMRTYLNKEQLSMAVPYAQFLVDNSDNTNHLINAYYCLMKDAEEQNNIELLSTYAHKRADAQKMFRDMIKNYTSAMSYLVKYVSNPNPLRWFWTTLLGVTLLCIILIFSIVIYRKHSIIHLQVATNNLQEATEKIEELSTCLEKQVKEQKNNFYNPYLLNILKRYPTPPNRWNEYSILKKDLDPYLHDWLIALENLKLTNREKVFCIFIFIYRHLPISEVADYMNITDRAVRVLKNRILKKIGISSSEFSNFLHNLSNCK